MPAFKRNMIEEIARGLEHHGLFMTEVAVDPPQQVVDIWWAAHAAARRLEKRVQVMTEARHNPSGQSLVITVRTRSSFSLDPSRADPPTDLGPRPSSAVVEARRDSPDRR